MKAVVYYRVSSKKQEETQSIALQKIRLSNFADKNGYEVVGEFQDDGISGEDIESRPGFQRCLERIAQEDIDVLLVYMVDRIGRFAQRKDRNRVIELLEDTKTNVDSPYHGLFHWDNEKEMNDLEGALNESRLDNVMRGIRVSEGHLAKRLAGKPRVNTPYSIRQHKGPPGPTPETGEFKQTREFYVVPAEITALQIIYDKLRSGWGRQRTCDFLNQDLDLYPPPKYTPTYRKDIPSKGIKKGDPRPKQWSTSTIGKFLTNSFYWTGIIQPTPAAKKKGFTPIDTGLKDELFTEDEIKAARKEASVKRWRTGDRPTIYTDTLFHGIAKCGYCGWSLGRNPVSEKQPSSKYRCYGDSSNKDKCSFKQIRSGELDHILWKELITNLEDPGALEENILKEEFILDEDRADLEAMRDKAQEDYRKIRTRIDRIKTMYEEEDIDYSEYKKRLGRAEARENEIGKKLVTAIAALERPQKVKESVKRATELVAADIKFLWWLEKWEETRRNIEEIWGPPEDDIFFEDAEEEKWFKEFQVDFYGEYSSRIQELIEEAMPMPEDLTNESIRRMIFQQQRTMLLKFVDLDRGIDVWSKDKFMVHLTIPKDVQEVGIIKQS